MYFSKSLNLPRIRENEISRGIQRATSTILISVSYNSMCVTCCCTCSRSGINGCAVTRASNDIFLIWHQLDLVLRGCSTAEYLCSVLGRVLELNQQEVPPGGGGGSNTARHCHGHKLYLHALIDISNCTCI